MPKRTAYVEDRSSSLFLPGLSIGVGAFLSIYPGASTSPNITPPDEPTIGTATVTAQTGDVVTIQWVVTMASTGSAASTLTLDVFDATDTTFTTALATQQVITTGIGLGAVVNVTFANLDGVNGATPRSFVLRAVAS